MPHAVEGGALDPTRGVLVSLQGIPQDLMCADQGTTYDQHVTLLRYCKTMQMEGGDREDDQHHLVRSIHTYPFQKVDAQKR